MITEVAGDILLTEAAAIAHGVAPDDHFTQGLALSLRLEWPSLAKDFRHFCHNESPEPGALWVWKGANGKFIINLLTQEPAPSHGQAPGKARLEYVKRALRNLAKILEKEKIPSCALPRLATGVGGLQWTDVRPLFDEFFEGSATKIILYSTFRKGVKAAE